VVFDRYTPLSRNEEIARRTLTPLTFRRDQAPVATAQPHVVRHADLRSGIRQKRPTP